MLEPDGRLELPNPCGAWPESVVFPWALQARTLFDGRLALPLSVPVGRPALRFGGPVWPGCVADGGRFALSCDMRSVLNLGLDIECALIGVFDVRDTPFIV